MRNMILVACAMLAGCAGMPPAGDAALDIQAGDRLVLERNLQMPPFGGMLYIQQGEPVSVRDVEELEPHCILRMRTVAEDYRNVEPDVFTITTVRHSVDDFGYLPGRIYAVDDSGGISRWFYKVDLDVNSPVQPDVMRLTCQVDRYRASGLALKKRVTRAEIQDTLRGLMRLENAQP